MVKPSSIPASRRATIHLNCYKMHPQLLEAYYFINFQDPPRQVLFILRPTKNMVDEVVLFLYTFVIVWIKFWFNCNTKILCGEISKHFCVIHCNSKSWNRTPNILNMYIKGIMMISGTIYMQSSLLIYTFSVFCLFVCLRRQESEQRRTLTVRPRISASLTSMEERRSHTH